MVGKRRQRDFDYTSKTIWKNTGYEHAGKIFSVSYKDRGDLFQNLHIWENPKYRNLQGSYPVIFLSFADVKETSFIQARKKICRILKYVYKQFRFLLDSDLLDEYEKEDFRSISVTMEDNEASYALKTLSEYLFRYYNKKVIILLDEYNTPMQEAFLNGYWEELSAFTRNLLSAAFKNNPYLERGMMTGITRISKESIFSDLNNLTVVTSVSDAYADCFGFTETEVFQALREFGLSDKKQEVKDWYNGFTFGAVSGIYNPWSVLHYLKTGKTGTYWANTSSNALAGKLIQEGSRNLKQEFEVLLSGKPLVTEIDEQIIYHQLPDKKNAIWSLLLTSGYLKILAVEISEQTGRKHYSLSLTNKEIRIIFENIIHDWFSESDDDYNDLIKALLSRDIAAMNAYMNKIAMASFRYFDTGRNPSREEPERFYHGFVLGLMVELSGRYVLTSNRESGFGRYDVLLEPKQPGDDGIILEFKVQDWRTKSSCLILCGTRWNR